MVRDIIIGILEDLLEEYGEEEHKKFKPYINKIITVIDKNIFDKESNEGISNEYSEYYQLLDTVEDSIEEAIKVINIMKSIDSSKISSEKINSTFKPYLEYSLTPLKNHLVDIGEVELVESIEKTINSNNISKDIGNIIKYIIPKSREALEQKNDKYVFYLLHEEIRKNVEQKFLNNDYSSAVFSAIKLTELYLQKTVENEEGKTLSGSDLVGAAFSSKKTIVDVTPKNIEITESSQKNIKEGVKLIFEGSIKSIRNVFAHEDIEIDKESALHHIFLCSYLLRKVDREM